MADQIELGVLEGIVPDAFSLLRPTGVRGTHVVDPVDHNPDLRFPESTRVYDKMRRTSGQIGSMLNAIGLPLRAAKWDLIGDDVKPDVIERCRQEFGLVELGKARRRTSEAGGVNFAEHLRDLLLALPLGFMVFEQVYRTTKATPAEEAERGNAYSTHVAKLKPLMPSTITQIRVNEDGGLAGVVQDGTDPRGFYREVFIPVENLVFYVFNKEGADWSGVSILRTAYPDWLIVDQLIRINAMAIERNGMGVPAVPYSDAGGVTKAQAEAVGRAFRSGATASVAYPVGFEPKLIGVTGGVHDALPTIKHHNEEMAKSALAMFLNLGHEGGLGDGGLGKTFLDFFKESEQATGNIAAEIFTEHVIRDFVRANYGPDEPYPVLTCGSLSANREIDAVAMKTFIDAGIIRPDQPLEDRVRADYGLPAAEADSVRRPPSAIPELGVPMADDASAEDKLKRGNFASALIRSGFDPAESMAAAGLDAVKHLGLLPVTLQPPAKGTDLDNAVAPVEPAGDEPAAEGEAPVSAPPATPAASGPVLPLSEGRSLTALLARAVELEEARAARGAS